MSRVALSEGLRIGALLAVCVGALAVLGLTPGLAWIPELPLIATTLLVPVAACGLAGFRAGRRTASTAAGALAGSLAGVLGGTTGGVAYVLFGKPNVNVAVGLIAGIIGGGALGTVGALGGRRRRATSASPTP